MSVIQKTREPTSIINVNACEVRCTLEWTLFPPVPTLCKNGELRIHFSIQFFLTAFKSIFQVTV